jgi:chitin disaccharide deacetylase
VKHLIVNADDFGYWPSVNRGIVESHVRGVLTSASLMVTGHAVEEAAAFAREHPGLSVGLHFDVSGEDERDFPTGDVATVRAELGRQLEEFERLLGRPPTHVDSHRHVHREEHLFPVFRELLEPLGIPLRGDGRVCYVGGFYAQWEWGVSDLAHVSVDAFLRVLREEVADGWTELGCHPGYADGLRSVYCSEREEELRTLTDPRLPEALRELGIRLASYVDFAAR